MESESDKGNVIGLGVSAVESCLGPEETVHMGGAGTLLITGLACESFCSGSQSLAFC